MGKFDELLKPHHLTEEELTDAEKKTLYQMAENLQKSELTLEKFRMMIENMRDGVSRELEDESEYKWVFIFKFENRKQIFLKARLKNLRLMLAILSTPQRARAAINEALSNIKK